MRSSHSVRLGTVADADCLSTGTRLWTRRRKFCFASACHLPSIPTRSSSVRILTRHRHRAALRLKPMDGNGPSTSSSGCRRSPSLFSSGSSPRRLRAKSWPIALVGCASLPATRTCEAKARSIWKRNRRSSSSSMPSGIHSSSQRNRQSSSQTCTLGSPTPSFTCGSRLSPLVGYTLSMLRRSC